MSAKSLLFPAIVAMCASAWASAQTSPIDLERRMVERRAVEAVIWGMPAVNAELMFAAMTAAKSDFNQVVYWSRPSSWKNQTLTPNPDTIYLMPFYNTKDAGPIVLEIPPAEGDSTITGSIDDAWQTALEDVGPAGVDKGTGGKYLILPPGYTGEVPQGYIALRSSTYAGFALLRSNLRSASEADIATAVAYGKRVRMYPLSQAAQPSETRYVDVVDAVFDSAIPYDVRFFQALDRVVQREPWLERDKAMIDMLKTLGIEKGKPFNPAAATQKTLADATREARAWLDVRYKALFAKPFNEGSHWVLPADPGFAEDVQSNFANPGSYAVDGRGVAYSMAFFSAKHLGQGQYYLMSISDRAGKPFVGDRSYRLHVPANAPVKLYWSATAYDRATHTLIRGTTRSSRGSNSPGLQKNGDGSIDVYFAPRAPAGKEANWIPTHAGAGFEVLFRFYGPEKPLFDKTWKLPDIEVMN